MASELIHEFVKSLIDRTLKKTLIWEQFSPDTLFDGIPASDLLSQCEFHQIYYSESYVLQQDDGRVFLVSELNESGRDERFNTEGFALYVQPAHGQPLERVLFDDPEIYQLINAISLSEERLTQQTTDFLRRFLQ